MRVVALCGSLRKESFNLKLLRNLGYVMPKTSSFSIELLHGVPIFNEDEEAIKIPDAIHQLADKIKAADVLVFGCPEYNYSVPGVLKNAIDWLSRHPSKPFVKKTTAILGASPGRLGSARAQYHLRQIGVFLDLNILNRPEIMLAEAHTKFDDQGRLIDAVTQKLLEQLVATLHKA